MSAIPFGEMIRHHLRKDLGDLKNKKHMGIVIEGKLYKTQLKPQLREALREYADVHFMTESEAVRQAIRQMIVRWKEGKEFD